MTQSKSLVVADILSHEGVYDERIVEFICKTFPLRKCTPHSINEWLAIQTGTMTYRERIAAGQSGELIWSLLTVT